MQQDIDKQQDQIQLKPNNRYKNYTELIKFIYKQDIQKLDKLMIDLVIQKQTDILNIQDKKGNTSLMLNIKLNCTNPKLQLQITEILLENGANPNIEDHLEQNPFEQAICQKNHILATAIYKKMGKNLSNRENQTKEGLDKQLLQIEDFYIEMSYQIDNNFIPLVQYLTPSDTIKIWKIGNQYRTEQNFAGYDKKSKIKKILRKNTSFIYNPDSESNSTEENKWFHKQVVFTSPDHKIYTMPVQKLTDRQYITNRIHHQIRYEEYMQKQKKQNQKKGDKEKEQQQSYLIIDDVNYQQSKSLFGRQVTKQFEGQQSIKFDIKLDSHLCLLENIPQFFNVSYNDYLENYIQDENFKYFQFNEEEKLKFINQKQIRVVEKQKNDSHNLTVWMQKDHPLEFKQAIILIKFLIELQIGNQKDEGEQSHPVLQNLLQVFQNKKILELFDQQGFPVKLSVPLNYKFFADIQFTKALKIAKDNRHLIPKAFNDLPLFQIPQGYQNTHWYKSKLIINETYSERMFQSYSENKKSMESYIEQGYIIQSKNNDQNDKENKQIPNQQLQQQQSISSQSSSQLNKIPEENDLNISTNSKKRTQPFLLDKHPSDNSSILSNGRSKYYTEQDLDEQYGFQQAQLQNVKKISDVRYSKSKSELEVNKQNMVDNNYN